MQPTTFYCTRCRAPLTPGSTQCANCGMTFDTPVPYITAPGYAAPPAKKGMSAIAIIGIVGAAGCLPMIAIIAAILFPVFAKARDKARENVSQSRLMQLNLACLQYEQDHNNKFPPMDSMEHFKAAVSPYAGSPELFIQPGVNLPYRLNADLSNKSVGESGNAVKIVVMQESAAHSDHKVCVAYADGHTKLVSDSLAPLPVNP